jgi:DNA modification methylase
MLNVVGRDMNSDCKLLLGDCLDVLKSIESLSVNLTVTSPPYDSLRAYEGLPFDKFKLVAEELFRVTKPGGIVVWVVGDATIKGSETGTSFRQALYFKEIGFNLHDTMIYLKNSYMPLTHNRYEQAFEYMFVLSKGKPKTFNPVMVPCKTAGTKRQRGSAKQNETTYAERKRLEATTVNQTKQSPNYFIYDVGKNDKTAHNAPFPEELASDHIKTWSNINDTVLDPFMGSGTTGKEALKLNRRFIGIELDADYFSIAKRRIDACNFDAEFK